MTAAHEEPQPLDMAWCGDFGVVNLQALQKTGFIPLLGFNQATNGQ